MTVVSVTRTWSGQGGSIASKDALSFERALDEVFDVVVNDPVNDDNNAVLTNPMVPQARDQHPDDETLRATKVDIQSRVSPTLYKVKAVYEAPGKPGQNPLNQPTIIKFSFVDAEEPIDEDVNGAPIVNVNNEFFDPPVKIAFSDLVITLEKNIAFFDPIQAWTYKNAVNSDSFLGLAPGTCRLHGIDAEEVADTDYTYFKQKAEIHVRRGMPRTADQYAWYKRLANRGMYEKVSGKLMKAVDDAGAEVTSPVLLNNSGAKITDPSLTVWLQFQVYTSLPFAALNIL